MELGTFFISKEIGNFWEISYTIHMHESGVFFWLRASVKSSHWQTHWNTYTLYVCIYTLPLEWNNLDDNRYSGRGKFMPLPLKSKILETPRSLVTDDMKMFPL